MIQYKKLKRPQMYILYKKKIIASPFYHKYRFVKSSPFEFRQFCAWGFCNVCQHVFVLRFFCRCRWCVLYVFVVKQELWRGIHRATLSRHVVVIHPTSNFSPVESKSPAKFIFCKVDDFQISISFRKPACGVRCVSVSECASTRELCKAYRCTTEVMCVVWR